MRIAIVGIYGLYNFGCEAIIRGCIEFFNMFFNNPEYIYYSFMPQEDFQQISDLHIDVKKVSRNRTFTTKAVNYILSRFELNFRLNIDYSRDIIDDCDVIISIGGDIYTIPEHKRTNPDSIIYNQLVQFGELALKRRKLFIIYGASIGPFGDIKKFKNYYLDHLKKVDLIICRELSTVEYLSSNGLVNNVVFMPDPAFLVRGVMTHYLNASDTIGLNLSELSLYEIFGNSENGVEKFAGLITSLVKETNMIIHLIPHVISPTNSIDNDYLFLSKIYNHLSFDIRKMVYIINVRNFFEAKDALLRCRVVISARMHCAINAITEGIPTIFLAYSAKARGMAHYIYGNEEFCFNINSENASLVRKVKELCSESDSINKYLSMRISQVVKDFDAETEKHIIRKQIEYYLHNCSR